MKRTAFLVFTIHTLSLGRDSWFGADKVKHFFIGAFVQSVAFGGLRSAGTGKPTALAGASGVTLVVAVAKELHDRGGNGTPSVRDVVWGLAGAASVSPLLLKTR